MANYKSQYTGEQIDEAIGKVLNAPSIYNYDGTVIIEKAESVLVRKFIDTPDIANAPIVKYYNVMYSVDVTFDGVTYDTLIVHRESIDGGYIEMIAYAVSTNEENVIYVYSNMMVNGLVDFVGWKDEKYRTFELTQEIDEWLLANTEGVSV